MIIQLHVRLLEVEPVVWRRIQVRSGISLYRLNLFILYAMGWENCHLSEFVIDGKNYGWSEFDEYGDGILEFRDYRISRSLLTKGKVFLFLYDFGDGWRHEITVEDHLPPEPGAVYPRCIAGAEACPPEDVGGSHSYINYLEAVLDPTHEEHEELIAWRGPFDPGKFDIAEATRRMQTLGKR